MGKSYTDPSKWDRLRWKVNDKVKHVNYEVWQFTEKVCRKILFVPKNREFDWLERVEGQPYAKVNSEKLRESIENSYIRFHGKPRREHYMDQTLRFIFLHWYQPIFTFKRWVRSKIDWFLFFRAREIHWKTHHYINRSGTDHIDGYFVYRVWGINCSRTLDLCSIQCLKHDSLDYDFKTKKYKKQLAYHDLNKYGSWGFPSLLVLKNKIMPKDIDKILNMWYDDQVEWKYRHWTWKGERPRIIVDDLHFICGRSSFTARCRYEKLKGPHLASNACEKCGLDMYGCQGHYGGD